MVKEVEELIKIVGKGNLLEAAFIYLGSFQHANLTGNIDHRNHIGLSLFVGKEEELLDKYFNLKFSLQGLFLIYAQAYKALVENAQFNTQEVIDKIYAAIEKERTSTDYSALRELLKEVVDQAGLTEGQKKLKLLNILTNPKGEAIFKTEEDFEDKILIDFRKLLSEGNTLNKYDREFALNKCVISSYYSIHTIKVDKDVALLFSIGSHYKKLSLSNKTVKREVLELGKNPLISFLAKMLGCIDLPNENGSIKYTLNYERIDGLNRVFNILADQNNQDFLIFKSIGPTLKQLLKKQNSNKFEEMIINNTYYSALQEENECRPNFIINKERDKGYRNTFCKLALGMFILSVGLYAADYFFMEQKLFNSIKPQTNLIIAAVLTIVVVYALFQLLKPPQEPPFSIVNGAMHENLMQSHARQI